MARNSSNRDDLGIGLIITGFLMTFFIFAMDMIGQTSTIGPIIGGILSIIKLIIIIYGLVLLFKNKTARKKDNKPLYAALILLVLTVVLVLSNIDILVMIGLLLVIPTIVLAFISMHRNRNVTSLIFCLSIVVLLAVLELAIAYQFYLLASSDWSGLTDLFELLLGLK